jgi:hypothetical protein
MARLLWPLFFALFAGCEGTQLESTPPTSRIEPNVSTGVTSANINGGADGGGGFDPSGKSSSRDGSDGGDGEDADRGGASSGGANSGATAGTTADSKKSADETTKNGAKDGSKSGKGSGGSANNKDIDDSGGSESPRVCKYTNKRDPAGSQLALPAPLFSDARILGGLPVPAVAAAAVLDAKYIPCLLSGPTIKVTDYLQKSSSSGSDLKFAVTAYKSMNLGGLYCVGYVFSKPADGTFLAEAEWKVTIRNAKSPDCSASVEPIPVTRGDVVGDPTGCFDGGSLVLMADGSLQRADVISVGDVIANPLRNKPYRIRSVVKGPEHTLGMVEVGMGGKRTVVTQGHPFLTAHGLKRAADLTRSDAIITAKGSFIQIDHLHIRAPSRTQTVYNFVVDAPPSDAIGHLVQADGIVSGDLHLQRSISNRPAPIAKHESLGR